MMVPQATATPFSILESFAKGMRLMLGHARLFAMLSIVPFVATFLMLVALRFTGGITVFWLPLVQAPANFVMGLQCALILRFLLLQEFPLMTDDVQRRARNRDVMQAAIVYTIVNYLFNGLMAGMMYTARRVEAEPDVMAPYGPLMMAGLVLVFFSMRWFWLFVPVALGWDIKGLFTRVAGWGGSLRIGGLFILCSLFINMITLLLRYMGFSLGNIASAEDMKGIWAVLDDGIVAASTVAMGILFTCSSAHAIKSLMVKK